VGQLIATRGNEFGSTTGRPRRCGWLDIPGLRRTALLNGITHWCLTKLDVLDTLTEIKVCTGYQIDGQYYDVMPDDISFDDHRIPIYESLPGWQTSTHGCSALDDLPQAAVSYLSRIAEWTGVPISLVSTGADREHIIQL
jgi:adenylosuccinate synthase